MLQTLGKADCAHCAALQNAKPKPCLLVRNAQPGGRSQVRATTDIATVALTDRGETVRAAG